MQGVNQGQDDGNSITFYQFQEIAFTIIIIFYVHIWHNKIHVK
jgi:hypothetical protein